jgi:hypothetical protein
MLIHHKNFPGETIVSIFDINGEVKLQQKYFNQSQIEIDLTGLSRGMYLVKIQTSTEIEVKKMVIQ